MTALDFTSEAPVNDHGAQARAAMADGAGVIGHGIVDTRWCPSSLAKLMNITPITMVFVGEISIVNGVYKPNYNWRGTALYEQTMTSVKSEIYPLVNQQVDPENC